MKISVFFISISTSLLIACSPGPQAGGEQNGRQVERKISIPKHQLEALDKARGVEQTLKDSDERRRNSLNEQ